MNAFGVQCLLALGVEKAVVLSFGLCYPRQKMCAGISNRLWSFVFLIDVVELLVVTCKKIDVISSFYWRHNEISELLKSQARYNDCKQRKIWCYF